MKVLPHTRAPRRATGAGAVAQRDRAGGERMGTQHGDLGGMAFPLLLRQLATEKEPCTLVLTSGGVRKTITARDGLVCRYVTNLEHEALGQHLLGMGLVADAALQEVLNVPRGDVLLGEALVAGGLLSHAHVMQALHQQATEGTLDVALWDGGSWALSPGPPGRRDVELLPGVSAGELAHQALERADVWHSILNRTPHILLPVAPLGLGDNLRGAFEGRLWDLAHHGLTAAHMAAALQVPLFHVVTALYQLLQQGHLRPLTAKDAGFAPPPVTFGGVTVPPVVVGSLLPPPPVTFGGPITKTGARMWPLPVSGLDAAATPGDAPPAAGGLPELRQELTSLQHFLEDDATDDAHAMARHILKQDPTNPDALAAKSFTEHLATQQVTAEHHVGALLASMRAQGLLPPARTYMLPPLPPARPPAPPTPFPAPHQVRSLTQQQREDADAFGDSHARVFEVLSPRIIPTLLVPSHQLPKAPVDAAARNILRVVDGRTSVAELVGLLHLDVVTVSRALLQAAEKKLVKLR